MAWVFASPEYVAAAASDLASIAQSLGAANNAAAFPTASVVAAGADDVSSAIAALFSAHAQAYQNLSAQAASFHQQFVELMSTGASQYASAEASNATPMQPGAAFSTDSSVGSSGSRAMNDGTGGAGAAGKAPDAGQVARGGHVGAAATSLTGGGTGATGGLSSAALPGLAAGVGANTGFFGTGGSGGSGGLAADDIAYAPDGGGAVGAPTPFLVNGLGTGGLGAQGAQGASNNSGSSGSASQAAVPAVTVESTGGLGSLGDGFLSGFGSTGDPGSLHGTEATGSFHADPGAIGEPGTPTAAH